MAKVIFKSYNQNDNLLFPPCLGDFIAENDPVRGVRHDSHSSQYKEDDLRDGCETEQPRRGVASIYEEGDQ